MTNPRLQTNKDLHQLECFQLQITKITNSNNKAFITDTRGMPSEGKVSGLVGSIP